MAGRHHVLLIGIDAYDGGGMLTGCVNDIDAVQRILVDRVGVPRDHITRLAAPRTGGSHETDVPSVLPTLAELRSAFNRLGTDAVGAEDRVLIYYSGHGTQLVLTDRNGQRFSREALLPKDKVRGADYHFLFDWELNALISRIAARSAAVTVVLDCCSAAGATRNGFDEAGANNRFLRTPDDVRLHLDIVTPPDVPRGVTAAVGQVPQCLVVAACRDGERARESTGTNGRAHGELTRALVGRLAGLSRAQLSELRWGRIWRAIESEVRLANPRQSPWLSGSFGRRVFGYGGDEDTDYGFAVTYAGGRYHLDIGTLAGVTEDAQVAVYGPAPPTFPPLGSAQDLAARKGLLQVSRADRACSEAVALFPFALPKGARGRQSQAGRAARLQIALAPHNNYLASLLAASPLVEVIYGGGADLTLTQRKSDDGWALTDDIHGTGTAGDPVLAVIDPNKLETARTAVEHYHDYIAPIRMARACQDLPSMLRLWLLNCNGRKITAEEAQAPNLPQVQSSMHAPYEVVVGDRLCFVVENGSDVDLFVTLIDSAPSGRVVILGEKHIMKRSRHVFWELETLGRPFTVSLQADVSVGVDRIAAIATTKSDISLRFLERRTGFAELLRQVRGVRDIGDAPLDAGPLTERWTSALTAVRVSHVQPGECR